MNTAAKRVSHRHGDRSIDGDDSAERADRVAGVRPDVGLADVGGDGDTAGVGVFDDHAGRLGEAVHQSPRGLGVVQVEVAEFLAAVLDGIVPPAVSAGEAVAGAELVRVLAVAQVLHPAQRHAQLGRQLGDGLVSGACACRYGRLTNVGIEPGDDLGVVRRRRGERLAGERAPGWMS